MKHALFCVDERPEAGRGHFVRSRALAAELESRGWTCDLAPDRTGMPDLLIYDTYRRDEVMFHAGPVPYVLIADKPSMLPEVWVDGGGTGQPLLIVDGGAGATASWYESRAANVLAGPAYALLREEFRNTAWPLNSDLQWLDARTFVGVDARQMACYMASAKVLITAAGMRAMEAACVGAPMLLFIESDDQESNARALEKRCAGIIVRDEQYARKIAKDLLRDPDWLARMSHAGRSLVDGLGCKRVADEIERLVA